MALSTPEVTINSNFTGADGDRVRGHRPRRPLGLAASALRHRRAAHGTARDGGGAAQGPHPRHLGQCRVGDLRGRAVLLFAVDVGEASRTWRRHRCSNGCSSASTTSRFRYRGPRSRHDPAAGDVPRGLHSAQGAAPASIREQVGVNFIGNLIFRTTFYLPANIPVGPTPPTPTCSPTGADRARRRQARRCQIDQDRLRATVLSRALAASDQRSLYGIGVRVVAWRSVHLGWLAGRDDRPARLSLPCLQRLARRRDRRGRRRARRRGSSRPEQAGKGPVAARRGRRHRRRRPAGSAGSRRRRSSGGAPTCRGRRRAAAGWRWPAISPSARPAGGFVAEGERGRRQRVEAHAVEPVRQLRIVVAGDPDPVAAGLQCGRAPRDRAATGGAAPSSS